MTKDSISDRGLVIISALLNFTDWMNKESKLSLMHYSKKERGKLVREFLEAHSEGKNYFMCAEDIAKRLGVPFNAEDL